MPEWRIPLQDILGFMEDDERHHYQSPDRTEEERNQIRAARQVLWLFIPDPSNAELRQAMGERNWQECEHNREAALAFYRRQWKRGRKAKAKERLLADEMWYGRFYISHLNQDERQRIRVGKFTPKEVEALAKDDDPWEPGRNPLPAGLLPPVYPTQGPGFIPNPPTNESNEPKPVNKSNLFAKIKKRFSKVFANIWPKPVTPQSRDLAETLPEMRDKLEHSIGSDRWLARFAWFRWLREHPNGRKASGGGGVVLSLYIAKQALDYEINGAIKTALLVFLAAWAVFAFAIYVSNVWDKRRPLVTAGWLIVGLIFFGVWWGYLPSPPNQLKQESKAIQGEPQFTPSVPAPSKTQVLSGARVVTGRLIVSPPSNKQQFFINVYMPNRGTLPALDLKRGTAFRLVDRELNEQEELQGIRLAQTNIGDPESKSTDEIQPGNEGTFFTANNPFLKMGDYKEIVAGKKRLYLFIVFKYTDAAMADQATLATEFCAYFTKDFTVYHTCKGHNRVFVQAKGDESS